MDFISLATAVVIIYLLFKLNNPIGSLTHVLDRSLGMVNKSVVVADALVDAHGSNIVADSAEIKQEAFEKLSALEGSSATFDELMTLAGVSGFEPKAPAKPKRGRK